MIRTVTTLSLIAGTALILSGCGVAKTTGKVAAAPFKATYAVGKGVVNTGEAVGGAAIDTGEFVGKGVYGTGKFVGEGVYAAGKGVYFVGSVPVKITDAALDTTERVLRITTTMVDLTGKTVTVAKDIQSVHLNNELAKLKTAKNVLSVLVDVAR